MAHAPSRPVLFVDDDAVSRRFGLTVLEAAGFATELAATMADARSALGKGRFACVVSDLELPDGDGSGILDVTLGDGVPAIAISAEMPERRREASMRVGFAAALQKPLSAAALVGAVEAAIAGTPAPALGVPRTPGPIGAVGAPVGDEPLLDDAAALAVGGARAVVDGLRALLRDELLANAGSVGAALASGDRAAARAVLHRMRASCGFCGAERLRVAAERLDAALARGRDSGELLGRFAEALELTRRALEAATAPG